MKDLFDECEFGNLHLNSRIIRTGTWEREIEKSWTLETVLQSIATISTIKAS